MSDANRYLSLRKVPSGAYLLQVEDAALAERTIAGLVGGGLFGADSIPVREGIEEDDRPAFFWGPEAGRYFFLDNVYDELAAGLRWQGYPEEELGAHVERLLDTVGLGDVYPSAHSQSPWALSGGQQQRLLTALILSRRPPAVVGLEPLIYVDYRDRCLLYTEVVKMLRSTGGILLLASQEYGLPLNEFAGTVALEGNEFLVSSSVSLPGPARPSTRATLPFPNTPDLSLARPAETSPLLAVKQAEWRYPDGSLGVFVPELVLMAGRIYVVCGPNGGGKSSLVRLLVSNRKVSRPAAIEFRGGTVRNPFRSLVMTRKMAFTFQDPNVHISGGTVGEYLSDAGPRDDKITALHLSDYVDEDMLSAPFWVRQGAVFLEALCSASEMLVLDESIDGLAYFIFGREASEMLVAKAREGRTIVLVTHNPEFAAQVATDYIWVSRQSTCAIDALLSPPGPGTELSEWLWHS